MVHSRYVIIDIQTSNQQNTIKYKFHVIREPRGAGASGVRWQNGSKAKGGLAKHEQSMGPSD